MTTHHVASTPGHARARESMPGDSTVTEESTVTEGSTVTEDSTVTEESTVTEGSTTTEDSTMTDISTRAEGTAMAHGRTLRVNGVSKSFGDRVALDDATFEVRPGRMTGFVGSNGAGKTTAMRIILGVLNADSGSVSLDGDRLSPEDRRRFGYMPEERGLYPKMKVAEQLVYLARLHGLPVAVAKHNTERLLAELGLEQRADDALESLSLGNQQRAQIAAALVHDPEILVLDEPFSGLDPVAVETVLGVLKTRAASGAPVLFSSHQLDIVERLCDDVVVIAGGTIRANGPREQLRDERAGLRFELVLDGDAGWVRDVPGVSVVDFGGGSALFDVDDVAVSQQVLRRALDVDTVRSFRRDRPSLAQIFREVIQ